MTDSVPSPLPIERRRLLQAAAFAALGAQGAAARPALAAEDHSHHQHGAAPAGGGMNMAMPKLKVAMLVYPGMVLMDLVGPMTVFNMMRGELHLVWKDMTPVRSEVGIAVAPTATFATCPKDVDILFVPGGLEGTTAILDDMPVLEFLADRGSRAKYVTSVCTGALALGAAGLLKGYKATTLWYVHDQLALTGAIPTQGRVVEDRGRITAGGVTAGLDFGLSIAMETMGMEHAKHYQLVLEYDPAPPLSAGSPEKAGPEITKFILDGRGPAIAAARVKSQAAGKRLKV
jgi:cyclohexyl-isocyanide hydratase